MLIKANAKINLCLKIKNYTQSGYHELDSVFQSVDLSDFLEIRKADTYRLKGSILSTREDQLITKALKKIEQKIGSKLPVEVILQKSIPVASGMGGGSADAAGLIVGINRLYQLELSKKKLTEIAKEVGSDVPFFITGGTKRVWGIGDKISDTKYDLANFYVIVRPHKRILTKNVFEKYRICKRPFIEIVGEDCPDVFFLREHFKKYPNKHFNMTGSGPTMFCGVDDFETAEQISYDLGNYNGDIYIVRPLDKAIEIYE